MSGSTPASPSPRGLTGATSPAAQGGQRFQPSGRRRLMDRLFLAVCIVTAFLSVLFLLVILIAILVQGSRFLNLDFVTHGPDPDVTKAGVWPALMGTVWVCALCAAMALPIGVATAVLLEEFRPRNRWLISLHHIVQLNITNLAGVPSVVYGILGLTAFASMFGLFGRVKDPGWEVGVRYFDQFLTEGDQVVLVPVASRNAPLTEPQAGLEAATPRGLAAPLHVIGPRDPLPRDPEVRKWTLRSDAEGGRISRRRWYFMQFPLGRGVLAGGLTLMLVTLPIVIISTQEAVRAVPDSLREGAFGLGATRWQTVWNVTLPTAIPGIMTGSILAMSRAIGEAAPILIIAGIVYISNPPQHLVDDFTVLPLQIYNWAQRPQPEFHALAASGIIVLLVILLFFNALAIIIRNKMQRPLS